MPRTVGHSRSTRATRGFSPARGEPRPVHITWIATCRVYNSVVVIRRITPGLSPGYENPTVDQSIVHSVLRDLGEGCRALQPAQKHIKLNCVSHVRVLDESLVMGFGGRQGRGGSTSRHGSNEDSKEKKEGKPSEVDISPDEIRKMVAKFLKELASNTNPKKAPRLLNRIPEEKIRALAFMRKLKFVTDPEFKDKYVEAERRRKIWFDENGWEFTPNVDPTELLLLSYDTVADVNGQTEQVDEF